MNATSPLRLWERSHRASEGILSRLPGVVVSRRPAGVRSWGGGSDSQKTDPPHSIYYMDNAPDAIVPQQGGA